MKIESDDLCCCGHAGAKHTYATWPKGVPSTTGCTETKERDGLHVRCRCQEFRHRGCMCLHTAEEHHDLPIDESTQVWRPTKCRPLDGTDCDCLHYAAASWQDWFRG